MSQPDPFQALRDQVFAIGPDGTLPQGPVVVDAQHVRDLLARLGGCLLFSRAYRARLQPFAEAFDKMRAEAGDARSVGHIYHDDDYDTFPVYVGFLRLAHELVHH